MIVRATYIKKLDTTVDCQQDALSDVQNQLKNGTND